MRSKRLRVAVAALTAATLAVVGHGMTASAAERQTPAAQEIVERTTGQSVRPLPAPGDTRLKGVDRKLSTPVRAFTSADAMLFYLEKGDPTRIVIETPGAEPRVNKDGSVTLLRGSETAGIDRPWAKDADGRPVSSHFEVQDGNLIQVVEASTEARYPLVADPKLTHGWGVYLNLTGYEVKAITTAVVTSAGIAGILACNTSSLPTVIGVLVKVLCIVVGGPSVLSIYYAIRSLWANGGVELSACYQKRILPSMGGWTRVAIGNCI